MQTRHRISPQQLADEILWAASSPHMLVHPHYPPARSHALAQACAVAQSDASRDMRGELTTYAQTMVMRSHFLGVRFEQAFLAACRFFGPDTVCEANLQVAHEGQTLGEFDLLLNGPEGGVHQELAVKFYLGVPGGGGHHIWFGPGQRDRLDLKLEALLQRQLRLSEDTSAVDLLASLGIVVSQVELVIKGYLFYPLASTVSLPESRSNELTSAMLLIQDLLTPEHCRGYWVSQGNMAQLRAFGDQWVILHKHVWLQPVRMSADAALRFDRFVNHVEDYFARETVEQLNTAAERGLRSARPLMAVALRMADGVLVEKVRIFITPDDWADRALQHLAPQLR
ncbi:DUF1853 family protein [Allohahella marinimesophila]|uniref:DUF1853 family protein n=1 Tax=Allohahella marinimesophila TaxID=1054972 RepID=A0ABP7Q162_9GAMM